MDYDGGNLDTLVADEKKEVTEAAAQWKEMDRWGHLTGIQTELYRFSTVDLPENY